MTDIASPSSHPPISARSWLFAPGDSERKIGKALAGDADIVIADLEDAVAEDQKARAREIVSAAIGDCDDRRDRLWVRVNPLDGPHTLADLKAVMGGCPGGIMLPKVNGRADVETFHRYLEAFEAANGIAVGRTPVIALVTETAAAMFQTGSYRGAPRLAAMTWGAEDLADAVGAQANTDAEGRYRPTFELARSLCLLGAAHAGVPAIETISTDYRDLEALETRATAVRRDGYSGMLAIHPAQVPVINAAFSPNESELEEAREIVAMFAANPGVGAIGWRGGMLDRPHLARAKALLARGE